MPRAEIRPPVAHVIDELPAHGAERLLADVLRHRSEAFEYRVVCLMRGGALADEIRGLGVPVTVLEYRGKRDLTLLWRLVRWLRTNRIVVVHTHLFTADAWGRLAAWLAGVPVIVSTVHSTNQWKGRLYRWVDRVLARASTRVIGCSEEIIAILTKRDHLAPGRLQVIRNGVALERFSAVTADGVRAELGLPETRPLLALVGRFHGAKGHSDLIGALGNLRTAGVACHCLFVGEGDLRSALEEEVDRRGLADMITFTGARDDVPRILAATDVLVLPSRWEGLPMILLEGMAMERAVVATRVGGIPDVIVDESNGLLVPPGDVAALGRALQRLIEDPGLRARLGRTARDTVSRRYNVCETTAAYEALYRQALGMSGIMAADVPARASALR